MSTDKPRLVGLNHIALGSLLCLMGSLVAFTVEVLIAGRNMLRQIRMNKDVSD